MFVLVDFYEGIEIIGEYSTKAEAIAARRDFIADTNGECEVGLFDRKTDSAFLTLIGA